MRFYASQSPVTGWWWVGMEWPRSKYRYGGCKLIHHAEGGEDEARAIAAQMNERAG